MRTFAVIVFTLGVSYAYTQPVYAQHCYSRWYYPYPQRCGLYARASIPVRVLSSGVTPPYRPDDNIQLPDLSAAWSVDDKSDGMQRLKGLRLLSFTSSP
jgi:hypothetical protein